MKFREIKDHPETHRQLVDILPNVKDEKRVDLKYCGRIIRLHRVGNKIRRLPSVDQTNNSD